MSRFLNVSEAAKLLGVSTQHLYILLARKSPELKAIKLGRRYLLPADQFNPGGKPDDTAEAEQIH